MLEGPVPGLHVKMNVRHPFEIGEGRGCWAALATMSPSGSASGCSVLKHDGANDNEHGRNEADDPVGDGEAEGAAVVQVVVVRAVHPAIGVRNVAFAVVD